MALCMMVSLLQGWSALATETPPDGENVYIADELPQDAEPVEETESVDEAEPAEEEEEEFATLMADSVTYLDTDGSSKEADATGVMDSDSAVTWSAGWYVVNGAVTIAGRITVSGTVNLILAGGANLTASESITVTGSNKLTIYAQSTGDSMGKLSAKGGDNQAGIGGGNGGAGGAISITGGTVTANGNVGGYSNNGDNRAAGNSISITGGTVTATVSIGMGAAIGNGGGSSATDVPTVTIGEGLTVKAGTKANGEGAEVKPDVANNKDYKCQSRVEITEKECGVNPSKDMN